MKKLLLVLAIFCMILPSCKKTTITLSVDKSEIAADGVEVAKFKVVANDEDDVTKDARIFFSDTNKEVGGTTFSTTEPKTYSFYATYDDATSEKVTVTAIEVVDEGGDDDGNDDGNDDGDDDGNDDVEVEGAIVLSASADTIAADGVETIEFTVMQDSVDVTSLAKFYVNDSLINSNAFKTTVAGAYKVYAKKNDTIVSNEISFFAKAIGGNNEGDDEEEKPIVLAADKTTITADGEEKITFTVTQDGTDVTEETVIYTSKDGGMAKKLDGNVFTTTEAGSYKVYAKKGDLKSNEINITVNAVVVTEEPIELTADKTTITADGIDAITFTVTQKNNDITNECEIFVNGGKLRENKYVTYAAGSFKAYAQKGTIKSNEITITVTPAPDLGKTVKFAEGVTLNSGWYDVNKVGNGQTNGDINMCWAASSSNIIQWWQDRYVAAGNTLPDGAITGKKEGSMYDLELMDIFHDQWDNSRGADVAHAVAWYFEGRNIRKEMSAGTYAQPLTGNNGGYFKDVWNDILPHVYHEYDYVVVPDILEYNDLISNQYSNYDEWGNGSGLQGAERLKRFSDLVIEFMDRGMISLTIALNSSLGSLSHATTLWGYEKDNATGLVTKIWITDSDDMTTEPKDPVLHEYSVGLNEGHGTIEFTGAPYGKCYAVSLYPVSGYGSR